MFVTTKTHRAAIREKDEVIEGLMKRLGGHKETIAALNTRLAPFERTRGKGGRFVKADADAVS